MLAPERRVIHQFWREIRARGILPKHIGVSGRSNLRETGSAGGRGAKSGLPIVELESRDFGVRLKNQNALRAKSAMDGMLVVGKLEGFGDLTNHFQASVDTQSRGSLRQKMVKAQGARIVLENEGRAGLVFRVLLNEQDVLVAQVVEDFVFPSAARLRVSRSEEEDEAAAG
jgi:hypothetical protein